MFSAEETEKMLSAEKSGEMPAAEAMKEEKMKIGENEKEKTGNGEIRKGKVFNGITEGIIWQQVLIYFFPILIGTFFQQLYNTVDTVIVGQFAGKAALSSVGGSSGQMINFVVGFFTGLSSGCSVVIARFYGAGRQEKLEQSVHTAYAFALTGGIGLGLMGVLLSSTILKLMNTPEELLQSSGIYLKIYFAGLVFIFIYNIGSAILRALGDSRRPLYYLILCCIINVILDLLFVIVFRLAVVGVAVATLIAQGVSAALVTITLMTRTPQVRLTLKKIRFYKGTLGKMLSIGLPAGIQACLYSISNIILQTSLNRYGVNTMAAWASVGKLDAFFWMVNSSFGVTISTFAGQNYGAGKKQRIGQSLRTCILMELAMAAVISLILLNFSSPLLSLFTNDPKVIRIGARMLAVIAPFYFFFVFVENFSGTLRAEGYVLVPTLIVVVGVCVFRMIWVLLIMVKGSIEEIVSCYPITWALCALLVTIYFIYRQRLILRDESIKNI